MKRCLAAVAFSMAYLFSPSRRRFVRAETERQEQERQESNARMFADIQQKQRRHWDTVDNLKRRAKKSERDFLAKGEPVEITVRKVVLRGGSYELLEEGVILRTRRGRQGLCLP